MNLKTINFSILSLSILLWVSTTSAITSEEQQALDDSKAFILTTGSILNISELVLTKGLTPLLDFSSNNLLDKAFKEFTTFKNINKQVGDDFGRMYQLERSGQLSNTDADKFLNKAIEMEGKANIAKTKYLNLTKTRTGLLGLKNSIGEIANTAGTTLSFLSLGNDVYNTVTLGNKILHGDGTVEDYASFSLSGYGVVTTSLVLSKKFGLKIAEKSISKSIISVAKGGLSSTLGAVLTGAQVEMMLYTYLRDKELQLIKNNWIRDNENNIVLRRQKIKDLVDAYVLSTKQNTPFYIFPILENYPNVTSYSGKYTYTLSDEFETRVNGNYIHNKFNKNSFDELTRYEKLLVSIRALDVIGYHEDVLLRTKMTQQQVNFNLGDIISGTVLGSSAYAGLDEIDDYKNIIFGDFVVGNGELPIRTQKIDFMFKTLMMKAINAELYQLGETLADFYDSATRTIDIEEVEGLIQPVQSIDSTMVYQLSEVDYYNLETHELTVSLGAEIRLSFDKYFQHKQALIDADVSVQPIKVQLVSIENPELTYFESAVWDVSTSQLVFNSPIDSAFKLVGIEYPAEDSSILVAFPNNVTVSENSKNNNSLGKHILSSGRNHTCALDDSKVNCWGKNSSGQADNVPLLNNPTELSAGYDFTCAIDDSGLVCWTVGGVVTRYPSLNNPTKVSVGGEMCTIDSVGIHCLSGGVLQQVSTPSLINPTQVSVGFDHRCALDDSGVVCWESNGYGQATVPFLANPHDVSEVSAGGLVTCVIEGSSVICWGSNNDGQTDIPSLSNPKHVSVGGAHVCALDDTGVVCWGGNGAAQTDVPSLSNPVWVSAGNDHTCALDDTGVVCWGQNHNGQSTVPDNLSFLGTTNESNPNLNSISLSAGGGSSFALKPDRTWLAWGANYEGKLGIGSPQESYYYPSEPATVVDSLGNDLLDIKSISTAMGHTIALKEDGSLLAWGANNLGQLGNGTSDPQQGPVEVLDSQSNKVTGIQSIVTSDERTIAIKAADGSLLTWGWDGRSDITAQFEPTGFNAIPQVILDGSGNAITGVQKVFSFMSEYGDYPIDYILKDNLLFTLEPNFVETGFDEFGYPTVVQQGNRLVPVMDAHDYDNTPIGNPLLNVKSVAMVVVPESEYSTKQEVIFLKADGTLVKWGEWFFSHEDGFTKRIELPVLDVLGNPVTGVVSISSGGGRSLVALKENGTLLTLGENWSGQLGNNSLVNSAVAVSVVDGSGNLVTDIQAIASGYGHSIALKSDGTVLTWGNNYNGELNVYPVYDQYVTTATLVTEIDTVASDPFGYEPSVYKSLNLLGTATEIESLTVGFFTESPKDYSIQTSPFIKTWTFSQELSGFNVDILVNTYFSVGVANINGNQVTIELTPDMTNAENRIDLQLTDSNGNIVKVDNSDTFWSITKTNHAPKLVNGQVTQMMGGIEDTLALTIDTFDLDNDAVTLSVVNADGGIVSFTDNRLYALFGDNQTIHNIQIALNDGKESVIVDIPVLRYDSNTVKTIYSDVAIEHPYAKDIAFATLNGVVWGQDDLANNQQRLFKPDNNASWAEALKMVVKAAKVAKIIDLPDSEFYLQAFPQWAMSYYTFAREQGAINFKQDDLSITYPTREEIAMLIVRSLGLDNKLEDYPQLTLEFADKAAFTDATMDRYGQIARIYGLFMTNDFAYPQGRVSRGELAQVISKIFMMPSAEIDVVNSVEFGDGFSINPLINRQAKIINDAYELVDNSANLAVEYAMNFQRLSDLTIDSSSMNVGSNTLIALVDNNGVRDFITKEIIVSFTDNDFDGVQDATDIWADDYRYQLDANQNQIPDILDSFYVLSGKTVEDTATMGHLTVPITQLISSGGFVCPQDEVTAFNPLSSEFQTFASLCDVPSAWVIFPGEPAIEPATGTYHSRVAVSLQSPASTIIYYTLDGSEPDTFSTVYSSPLRLDESATVKMIAVSGDGEVSPMMSASYTVLNKHVWTPIPGLSWQWQLQGAVDQSVSARVYDVDLIDTPKETIATLHANGSRVICYFNAGAWENWRSDAADYPEFIKGNAVDGYVDEQWLDIRELDTLSPLMQTRFDLAVSKGCDAVEPDNMDGYSNNTGFALTANDQLNYNLWLSNQANTRGLSIGLKNNLAQIPTLEPFFDWALNEQCLEFNECDALQPFIASNKAVFGVEYLTETNIPDTASVCAITEANQYSWIIKRPELDSWVDSCADYRDFIDEDNDGVVDYEDNCLDADNLSQRDTDNDGFGNRCDADLNNDGVTNFADLAKFKQNFMTSDPDADLNGDGIVNFADIAIVKSLFFAQPGPAAGH